MSTFRNGLLPMMAGLVVFGLAASRLQADPPLVPGTGQRVEQVGDDFEDEEWKYNFNGQKSSREQDNRERAPAGASENGRWYEGIKRGHPDIIRRVETPSGGLPGSKGALGSPSCH